MNQTIIYEDNDLLVLNKTAGITVNRSATTKDERTVQDFTTEYLHITRPIEPIRYSEGMDENEYYKQAFLDRGGIAHRLDKETSGILLVAKNPFAFAHLLKQFKNRTTKKTYIALVHGKVSPKMGEINVPVDRLPWNRKRFGIMPGGREAITFYTVKAYYTLQDKRKEVTSLLELEPKTGRTHQIRVHMKYFNHPIVSDFLYAGRKTSIEDRKLLSRVFLHAAKITLRHPVTDASMTFEASLAKELSQFLTDLLIPFQE